MIRPLVLTASILLSSSGFACSHTAPGEPETPAPPGPLEPEHEGRFVPSGDEPAAPDPKSMLVDAGGPR